jgi:hypothetical protein
LEHLCRLAKFGANSAWQERRTRLWSSCPPPVIQKRDRLDVEAEVPIQRGSSIRCVRWIATKESRPAASGASS